MKLVLWAAFDNNFRKNIQTAAQYGLRQNLSRIQVVLNGFSAEPQSNFVNIQRPDLYGFYVGGLIQLINLLITKSSCVMVSYLYNKYTRLNRTAIIADQPLKEEKKSIEALLSSFTCRPIRFK